MSKGKKNTKTVDTNPDADTTPLEDQINSQESDDVIELTPVEKLEKDIVAEAIKITKNETSSCYGLVIKTKELLALKDVIASM